MNSLLDQLTPEEIERLRRPSGERLDEIMREEEERRREEQGTDGAFEHQDQLEPDELQTEEERQIVLDFEEQLAADAQAQADTAEEDKAQCPPGQERNAEGKCEMKKAAAEAKKDAAEEAAGAASATAAASKAANVAEQVASSE